MALKDTTGAGPRCGAPLRRNLCRRRTRRNRIALYNGHAEINDRIVRYPLRMAQLFRRKTRDDFQAFRSPVTIPCIRSRSTPPGTCLSILIGDQRRGKEPHAIRLGTIRAMSLRRGGIPRYDGNRTNQRFSPKERFATGLRNGEGLT